MTLRTCGRCDASAAAALAFRHRLMRRWRETGASPLAPNPSLDASAGRAIHLGSRSAVARAASTPALGDLAAIADEREGARQMISFAGNQPSFVSSPKPLAS